MLHTLILVVHVTVCLFLIFIVLLQRGKGADMGAVFGGSSNTILGASGAVSFLQKLTTACAIIFMVTSLYLAYTSSQASRKTVADTTETLKKEQAVKPAKKKQQEKKNLKKEIKKEVKKQKKTKKK